MSTSSFSKAAIALAFCGLSVSAFATTTTTDTIYASSLTAGSSSVSTTFLGGVNATFSAWLGTDLSSLTTQAKFSSKGAQGYIQGVGVSPKTGSERTSGEIDIGEVISGSFSKGVVVKNFTVGLLFDGPEYSDVNEVAQVSVLYKGDKKATNFTLTAIGRTTAVWSGSNGTVTNLFPADNGNGGAWKVGSNPFGNKAIESIYFTSVTGIKATSCSSCTNQSDYTFNSITAAVPEPETYALLLAGLGLMGAVVKRRKAKQA
jgi:hypothetical protein